MKKKRIPSQQLLFHCIFCSILLPSLLSFLNNHIDLDGEKERESEKYERERSKKGERRVRERECCMYVCKADEIRNSSRGIEGVCMCHKSGSSFNEPRLEFALSTDLLSVFSNTPYHYVIRPGPKVWLFDSQRKGRMGKRERERER